MIDKISQRLLQEKKEALDFYPGHDWFVIALQGSQNYGVADEKSDIDSKLLLIPTFDEIVFAANPISHTHEMSDTGEHVDCKDVRAYMKQFRKCNINFVEILFTDYFLTCSFYSDLWVELRRHREEIARINPYQAISAMAGMASMKMKALDHPYPSRMHMIEKYGYDPKQLSHLVRIEHFTEAFIYGAPYDECIKIPDENFRKYLLQLKRDGAGLSLDEAKGLAENSMNHILEMKTAFQKYHESKEDENTSDLLDSVLREIIARSLKRELEDM